MSGSFSWQQVATITVAIVAAGLILGILGRVAR